MIVGARHFLQGAVVSLQHSRHGAMIGESIEPMGCCVTEGVLSQQQRENGAVFAPKFDGSGLITAVVVDAASGAVLVVAYMNAEALAATLAIGKVHFWSRSRERLWMKGETSGHILQVEEVRVDCDQDALLIRAVPAGPTCHTGAESCFYRQVVVRDGEAVLTDTQT